MRPFQYREVYDEASLLEGAAVQGHSLVQDALFVSRLDQIPWGTGWRHRLAIASTGRQTKHNVAYRSSAARVQFTLFLDKMETAWKKLSGNYTQIYWNMYHDYNLLGVGITRGPTVPYYHHTDLHNILHIVITFMTFFPTAIDVPKGKLCQRLFNLLYR